MTSGAWCGGIPISELRPTTPSRIRPSPAFFAQPEITHQLRQTSQQLRAERRARTSRRRTAQRQN
jgi:hypothetical protein